ncbi:hypothetical protein BDW75DRAFT_90214 [Aspergillus navahoensis]
MPKTLRNTQIELVQSAKSLNAWINNKNIMSVLWADIPCTASINKDDLGVVYGTVLLKVLILLLKVLISSNGVLSCLWLS